MSFLAPCFARIMVRNVKDLAFNVLQNSHCLPQGSLTYTWAITSNFLRGAFNFCILLRSCTAWRTDSIWEDYRSAQMYNTVCWPKQSVSVPFAFYIKKNC